MMSKKEVQTKLREVFAGVKHPGNSHLLRKDLEFPQAHLWEIEFLFRYEGRPWYEIDKWELLREEACFTFLSDAGLLYVIPAYLYHCYQEKAWFDILNYWDDRLLQVLAEKGRGDLRLTSEQIRVIDEVFFRKALREWGEYGTGASSLGYHWGDLITKARSNYGIDSD